MRQRGAGTGAGLMAVLRKGKEEGPVQHADRAADYKPFRGSPGYRAISQ
jgi:hypothetical protein